jgi:CubicO group peptidase (beta-lactamase class C family)
MTIKQMLNRYVSLLLILIATLSASSLSACKPDDAVRNNYEEAAVNARTAVWQDINSGKAGSAAVAIMENGEIVYSEGFGMADRENSIPVDNETIFNIGSVSKVYCATAIMLLGDDGELGLDTPVMQYLPEFTMSDIRYKDITVRMLLNHTSGLPGTSYANAFGTEYNTAYFKGVLDNLSRSNLKHDPGSMASYCNDGFTLAEMVVERVSGEKYIDFLAERIFKPLSVSNTGLSVGEQSGETVAHYYQPDTGRREPPEVLSCLGAGGLAATAEDLCRFFDTFSEGGKHILSGPSLEEMKKAQPSSFTGKLQGPSYSFGLGWDVTSLPQYQSMGIQVLGKSGGTSNYLSQVYIVPEQNISVAVIVAGQGSQTGKICLDILSKILEEKGLTTSQTVNAARPLAKEKLPQGYADFSGYYATDLGLYRLSVDDNENTITINICQKGIEAPVISLFYNNSYLHDDLGEKYYLTTVDGRGYLVQHSETLSLDAIVMEKLAAIESPQKMKTDVDGKLWLRRNVFPFESVASVDSHVVQSHTLAELPGYIEFHGVKSIDSPGFAGMATFSIRDQTELTLFEMHGELWARVSDMLYSPAESALSLEPGECTVRISDNGFSEWLKVADDTVIGFGKPCDGRVVVFSPDGSPVYDSILDEGDVYVMEGSFIEVAGVPGDTFVVNSTD